MSAAHRRIVHLSDVHLTASGSDEDGVDARGSLQRMLADLRWIDDVDLVIVSGDLADDGSVAGYRALVDLVGGFAAERGVPWVCCTGNHDDREHFAQVLGSGHHDRDGRDVGHLADAATSRAAVSEVDGLRVITLDSLVPGHGHGEVHDQLAWLRAVLAEPAPRGSVVVLHHPPISPPGHPMGDVVLRDPDALGAAIAGTDVQAVLCGHLHQQLSGALGGVPVWTTPGVVTRIDATSPQWLVRGVLGASATVVDLGPGGPLFRTVHARDPRAGEEVYLVDARTWQPVPAEVAAPR